MFCISLLVIAALATPPALANADAAPTARARTVTHDTRDAVYSYAYNVDFPGYKNFYDHEEARNGEVTRGRFRVALPDNRLQTVIYRAGSRGYSAQILYDQHPDFQSLRASVVPVGPIREGPAIGQAVVPSVNWKNQNGPHSSQHEDLNSNVLPDSPRHHHQSSSGPRPTSPFSSAPVNVRPRPTSSPFKARQTADTKQPQGFRSAPQRAPPSTKVPRFTSTATGRPRPAAIPPQSSIFVSTEGLEDPGILNRLVQAIRLKEAEEAANHPDDDSSHEKKNKPRYTIADKPGVIARLRAIVHDLPISKI